MYCKSLAFSSVNTRTNTVVPSLDTGALVGAIRKEMLRMCMQPDKYRKCSKQKENNQWPQS